MPRIPSIHLRLLIWARSKRKWKEIPRVMERWRRGSWRGARKWIRQKHGDKEPLEVINNSDRDHGSTVRTLQPTLDIISRLQHLLEDMLHPPPFPQSRLILILHLSKHACLLRWNQITLKHPRRALLLGACWKPLAEWTGKIKLN